MYIFLNFFNESSPPFLGWFLKKKKDEKRREGKGR